MQRPFFIQKSKKEEMRMKRKNGGFIQELKKSVLLMPAVVVLIIFFCVPILMAIYYSFTNLALSGEAAKNLEFVGLKNYTTMLKDRNVRVSIKNTLVFLVGCLAGQQILGFLIALFMRDCNSTFRRIVGPIILAGWVMPEVVVALCCSTFFGLNGTLNQILASVGLRPVEWLFAHPMLTIVLANVWHGTAFSMMNFQSALDGVSPDIEEAARVEGASAIQITTRIIIPCIKDTIGTCTMLNTLSTLGVFGLVYTMTGGGPGTSTLTLPILMYRQAFVSQELGYGTAISMIILTIGVVCSLIYTKLLREE